MNSLFDQRFPADLSRMSELRATLREALELRGVSEDSLERLILVVDEVVANSIEHGEAYRRSSDPIRVEVRQDEQGLEVEVEDNDVPQDLATTLSREFGAQSGILPSVDHERGRGMFLVTLFLKGLRVTPVEGGGMRLQGRLVEGDV